jgi:hypothetical protein
MGSTLIRRPICDFRSVNTRRAKCLTAWRQTRTVYPRLCRLERLLIARGAERLQRWYLDRFQATRGRRKLCSVFRSIILGRWRSRSDSKLQWRKFGLTSFLFFALACATDELEVGVVYLILTYVMTFDVLPDVALLARDLRCVVVLATLAGIGV